LIGALLFTLRPTAIRWRELSSTFDPHVERIGGLSAKKEIIWFYAWRIIATVKNVQPFRDRTVMDFPRYTVSKMPNLFTISATANNSVVTLEQAGASPNPTGIGFLDFIPKPLCHRYLLKGAFTLSATVNPPALRSLPTMNEMDRLARWTNSLNVGGASGV